MEKTNPTTTTPKTKKRAPYPPIVHYVLAGVAFGASYLMGSGAINTGSLLLYAATLVMFFLGIKHIVQAVWATGDKK